MAHKIGTVDQTGTWNLAHYNMLETIREFALGYGEIENFAYDGDGNGTMTNLKALPDAVDETWTVTCKADTSKFSVSGSVSGNKDDAIVGTPYANTFISFTIIAGATPFVEGDKFTFNTVKSAVVTNEETWEQLRYDTSTANHELILKGKGLTGTEQIYVGFRTYQNADADYYNLVAMTATGYVAENTFDTQPGVKLSGIPAHNQAIQYWITLNAQRIALVMKVGTPVYEMAYVGKIFPYARPQQYPYPVICAGMLNGVSATKFSDTAHSMPWKGNRDNLQLRNLSGEWEKAYAYPYSNNWFNGYYNQALRDTGGYYHLIPIELYKPNTHIYGTLDGIYFITGFNNAVENYIVIDDITYIVFQDVWRTGFGDLFAMKMEA